MTLDLASLKEIEAKATPGPWSADLDMFTSEEGIVALVVDPECKLFAKIPTDLVIAGAENGVEWTAEDSRRRDEQWAAARAGQEMRDATLIAAARNALPELLSAAAERDALRAENARLSSVWQAAKAWRESLHRTARESAVGTTGRLLDAIDAALAAEKGSP